VLLDQIHRFITGNISSLMITGLLLVLMVGTLGLHCAFLFPFNPFLIKPGRFQKSIDAAYDHKEGFDDGSYYDKLPTGIYLKHIDEKLEVIRRFNEVTNNTFAGAIREKLNMLWTYNSLAMEGNSLTYGDTIFYLHHGLSVAGKPIKDFLEASGHMEAIASLQDFVGQPRPFSHYFACTINHLLTGNVTKIPAINTQGNRILVPYTAGRYRTRPTHVLTMSGDIHKYVDAFLIDGEMANLIDFVNNEDTTMHPIIKAAIAHYNFVRIHPFQDGNGRGARILMNLVLIKAGLFPTVVQVTDKVAYLGALGEADRGDISPFVGFIATSMEKTLDIVIETIQSELK
jgi:Fic family protein